MRRVRRSRSSIGWRFAAKASHALLSLAWAPTRLAAALSGPAGRMSEIAKFGSNPGALKMLVYMPPERPAQGAPLIILMHGCGQDAAGFAENAGWLALARAVGATLVLPQQVADNNRGRCFNWYRSADTRRGSGEAMSIRQMIRTATALFGCDPRRVYIVGLSAGGAMAVAMLAAYPTVFAAGAVVAGLPLGTAKGPLQALARMGRADQSRTRASLADAVRSAAPASRKRIWPRLSIWQGETDRTIDPAHAELLAAQWSAVNDFGPAPMTDLSPWPGVRHRSWHSARRVSVELWTIAGLGHGFPIDPKQPAGGRPGPWVIDAGIPATLHIGRFWGLLSETDGTIPRG